MLLHPILNALFNEDALVPSKQLQAARQQLQTAGAEPHIVILLPPIELLTQHVDCETFYHDTYLLSHVALFDWHRASAPLLTLNGGNWYVNVTDSQVVPDQGFPAACSAAANISAARMWSPGLAHTQHNATFFVLELDSLILSNATPRRFSIFTSPNTSTPKPGDEENSNMVWDRSDAGRVGDAEQASERSDAKLLGPESSTLRHPALELGRTKAQKEQNMAKFDYILACLQQDVASTSELAERYHKAVHAARQALADAGAIFVDTSDNGVTTEDGLTTRSIYDYAESKLAPFIFAKLDDLLARERDDIPFPQIQRDLKSLDLSQVEIPGLQNVRVDAYERAIARASDTLNDLVTARDSESICTVFLQVIHELTNPRLGTISADTLLGLLMLTVLRSSRDVAAAIERDLFFVSRFSFRSADAIAAHVSAGGLSYTLMVFESVILQLRMDRKRFAPLANLNTRAWHAAETGNRHLLRDVFEKDKSALKSRKAGRSVLFLAAEQSSRELSSPATGSEDSSPGRDDQDVPLLAFILQAFASAFDRNFVLRDRDMHGRTLLMSVLDDVASTTTVLDIIGEDSEYLRATDIDGRSLAHLLHEPILDTVVARVGHLLSWTQRDAVDGDTPLLALARKGLLARVVQFCENFWDHLDHSGNSLLHLAANASPQVLMKLLMLASSDVNWANSSGYTPLMVAIPEQSIELLLQAGADAWYFDNSDAEQTSSPALRRSLYSQNASNPVVQNAHRPDERLVFQPTDTLIGVRKYEDFLILKTQLRKNYPFSWSPRLEWLYHTLRNEGLGHHFFGALLWDDAFRTGYWLRLLTHHGTFRSSPPLAAFLSPENSGADVVKATAEADRRQTLKSKGSQLDREELMSITHFCQFSIEQLGRLEAALREFCRGFLATQEKARDTASLVATAHEDLEKVALLIHGEFTPLKPCGGASFLPRETSVILDQITKSVADLRQSLTAPIKLSHKLSATKSLVVDCRQRLQALAGSKSSPSWLLPRLETKRVSDIQALEDGVSNARKTVTDLEVSIRETHYALASELSAFNMFQEEEIVGQIGKWAQHRLQAARDELCQLEYGFRPRRQQK